MRGGGRLSAPDDWSSRSELYATALRTFVERHDEAAKRGALDELYAIESSALPAGAARTQVRVASEWEE